MNIFSPTHMLIIGVVALLLFGHRLPEVARSIGRAINEFKKGLREVNDEVTSEPPHSPQISAPKSQETPRLNESATPGANQQQPTDVPR